MPPPGKRGKYLGFVAHEIKNPLATALWSCDLLKRMDSADRAGERAEKMIDVSLRALRRMRRLIDDFFTIERLLEHGYEVAGATFPVPMWAVASGMDRFLLPVERGQSLENGVDVACVPVEIKERVEVDPARDLGVRAHELGENTLLLLGPQRVPLDEPVGGISLESRLDERQQ